MKQMFLKSENVFLLVIRNYRVFLISCVKYYLIILYHTIVKLSAESSNSFPPYKVNGICAFARMNIMIFIFVELLLYHIQSYTI